MRIAPITHMLCRPNVAAALLVALTLPLFQAASQGAPRLECPRKVYDFGKIYNRDKDAIEHSFKILNKGDSDLRIAKVRGCCGAKAHIDRRVVPPGSSATLKVVLSLRGRKGRIRKSTKGSVL